jgi:glucose/arabinose dehydrogenase
VRRAVAITTLCCSLTFAVSACASSGDERDRPAAAAEQSKAERAAAPDSRSRPDARAAATGVRLQRVGTFDSPTYLAAPPGDSRRRFVTERDGRIVLLRGGRRTTFLDIGSDVQTGGESGLLSMAFHPGYARNRRYFVYYVDRSGAIVVAQLRATADGNRTRPGSRRLVLRQPHPRFNHKGGQLQFGPDGMLYAGFGDGGGGGDPDNNAQRLSTLLGKILRIDPRPGGGYAVPRDNPFRGRRGARGEVFAYGLRNPYRFSFDRRGDGDMTIGDVGQDAVEEISFLPAVEGARRPRGGANLGWSVFEGRSRFRSGAAPGHVPPAIQRTHAQGSCSITGGYVIRDPALGTLRGSYVYADLCDARLRVARLRASGARRHRALGVSVPQTVSFGEDARGRVYVVSLSGGVFRLAPRR